MREALEKIKNWTFGSVLDLSNLQLTKLPTLPRNVEHLDLTGNYLTKIHSLPNSIKELHCDFNTISMIESLPKSLVHFSCNFNSISDNSNLLKSIRKLKNLKYVSMINNDITKIDGFPDSVVTLKVSFSPIENIHSLPKSLISLEASHCDIKKLPKKLPKGLVNLIVEDSRLYSLPKLPETLIYLNCNTNLIETLPKLPSGLKFLYCDYNYIKKLSNLPESLEIISVAFNNIESVGNLPSNVKTLDFRNNPIFGSINVPDSVINLNGLNISELESSEDFKSLPFEDFYTLEEEDKTLPINLLLNAFDFINFDDVNISEFLNKDYLNIIIKCGSQLYAYNRKFLMDWFKNVKNRFIYKGEDYFRTPLNHTISFSDVIKINFLDYKYFEILDTLETAVKNGTVIRVSKMISRKVCEI